MMHKQALLGGVAFVVLGAASGPALADHSNSYCYAVTPVIDVEAVVAEEVEPVAFLRLGVRHHTTHTSSRERRHHRHPRLKTYSVHGFAIIPEEGDDPDLDVLALAPDAVDLDFLNEVVNGTATFAHRIGGRMALRGPSVGEIDCLSEGYYAMPDQWTCRAIVGPARVAVEETTWIELTRVNPRHEERCGLFALPDLEPDEPK